MPLNLKNFKLYLNCSKFEGLNHSYVLIQYYFNRKCLLCRLPYTTYHALDQHFIHYVLIIKILYIKYTQYIYRILIYV